MLPCAICFNSLISLLLFALSSPLSCDFCSRVIGCHVSGRSDRPSLLFQQQRWPSRLPACPAVCGPTCLTARPPLSLPDSECYSSAPFPNKQVRHASPQFPVTARNISSFTALILLFFACSPISYITGLLSPSPVDAVGWVVLRCVGPLRTVGCLLSSLVSVRWVPIPASQSSSGENQECL